MARIECYIEDNTKSDLKERASKQGLSLSKYVSKILSDHVNSHDVDAFNHTKTHTLLAHIFSCVYDESFHKNNAETIRDMLKDIDSDVKDKVRK